MNPRMRETFEWLRSAGFLVTGQRAFVSLANWDQVLEAAHENTPLWYQAPLDRYPVSVQVVRVYKYGGIRLHGGDCTFTADAGHLDRFRVRGVIPATPSLPQTDATLVEKARP